MRYSLRILAAILLILSGTVAFADLEAIDADKLPQETAVLAALDDARQLEAYSASWTATWNYPVSKDEVAARLGKDVDSLRLAIKNHPENVELLLLTGLVARYAYNLDVTGSHDTALDSLEESGKLAPGDVRAPWFRATLLCQTAQPTEGGNAFLAIEAAHAWDQLSAAFWEDYMECASVTNMPAHVLRAAGYLAKMHAPASAMGTFLADGARKRFEPFDPNKKYEPKEVWTAENAGNGAVFTSTTCGVRFHVHGDWTIKQLTLNSGSCVAYFSTGPYKATVGDLHPSVVLIVQRPGENETLENYSKRFLTKGDFSPDTESPCPADHCIALKAEQPGMYQANGDGHGRILVFERDEPAFPGLIFESPAGPPTANAGDGPHAFRPLPVEQRIPGKLFYLVMLDTAASIEGPARKDYEFFLQNLIAE
jgi:hypothetical protein